MLGINPSPSGWKARANEAIFHATIITAGVDPGCCGLGAGRRANGDRFRLRECRPTGRFPQCMPGSGPFLILAPHPGRRFGRGSDAVVIYLSSNAANVPLLMGAVKRHSTRSLTKIGIAIAKRSKEWHSGRNKEMRSMADAATKRDRSPNFPCVPLKTAVERLVAFEKYFGRHPAPIGKIGLSWGLKENSDQASQVVSAMRYYGLIDYQGNPPVRQAVIAEPGRLYLRAQQESIKQQVLAKAALTPRMINKFWGVWGADRPPDPIAIDDLTLHNGFSERGAPLFLKIYDATIAFAGLAHPGKTESDSAEATDDGDELATAEIDDPPKPLADRPSPSPVKEATVMEGERELTTGLLSKDASFRLIVSGPVGVREIERLIKKLELDKEILADESEDAGAEAG
jgi:hypothetical protein